MSKVMNQAGKLNYTKNNSEKIIDKISEIVNDKNAHFWRKQTKYGVPTGIREINRLLKNNKLSTSEKLERIGKIADTRLNVTDNIFRKRSLITSNLYLAISEAKGNNPEKINKFEIPTVHSKVDKSSINVGTYIKLKKK